MIPQDWLDQASLRIAPHIHKTSITNDPKLNIFLKWENHQITGSFKARGAINKILSLNSWEYSKGIVTASAGNHGRGVAFAGNLVNTPVLVYASNHASSMKLKGMHDLGADVHLVQGGYEAAEAMAIQEAEEQKRIWISPYNDGQVIAGQATVGTEIGMDLPPEANQTWLVPVGGGGLLAGVGLALETFSSHPRLVGVGVENSAFMHSLYHTGSQNGVKDAETLADGLSGAVQEGSLTIPLVKKYADDMILVTEQEIISAIAFAWQRYEECIEGSAAVSLAAVLSGKVHVPAVVIITGGNIQPEVHMDIRRRFGEIS